MRTSRSIRIVLALLVATCISIGGWRICQPTYHQTIKRAERLVDEGKLVEAMSVLEVVLRDFPNDPDACYAAGQICARMRRFERAVDLYLRVPVTSPRRSDACFRAGDIFLLRLFRPSQAEVCLQEALSLIPSHTAARSHLAGLYGLCGLTSRTAKLRFQRICAREFEEVDLVLLALGDTAAENAVSLSNFIRESPNDPFVLLAQGYECWQKHDLISAKRLYKSAIQKCPDLEDAQARLGRILCELAEEAEFVKWYIALPTQSRVLPETWAVFGDWSMSHGDTQGAIRCYWEACRLDPTHRRAHHRLGQALASLGETDSSKPFQQRNENLQEYLLSAKQFTSDPSPECMMRSIHATLASYQPWEAWGWAELIRKRHPSLAYKVSDIRQPAEDAPRVLDKGWPARNIDLANYPLPTWMYSRDSKSTSQAWSLPSKSKAIHFTDDSLKTGLHFRYINGDDIPGPGMRIFQFTGGGVGVLDYDHDGWPDLYFAQGGKWPAPDPNPPFDALFRNHEGKRFQDVTEYAGIREIEYSQGVTIFDFDSDGFEDLFVANVACNRLFRNNGDGTFEDITTSAVIGDSQWSVSSVGADFNGDGLPDLYVVNYLTGPNLLDRICRHPNGRPRACTPHEFQATEDQFLLNLGDGRFRDLSEEAGVIAPGGKGLGVVAADFDGSGQLSLFVANDTTANFFFLNRTPSRGDMPRFQESALVSGLAFDSEGRTQACMGIAIGDSNGDHRLDLFVTNYYDESNTLYQRQPGLFFLDAATEARLKEPSLKQLGFGTQFLDADLDGWSDLVVTNGHVDDETERKIPLHMPTQFFHNTGQGRFVELDAHDLGPWFQRKRLGRGIARLDWNRDGKEDFAVSTLDDSAALMTNTSEDCGNFLVLQLVGVVSERQPIGATVLVQPSVGRTQMLQLTAGDGYESSNQRQLIFGVGPAERVDVSVTWPSGIHQSFTNIEANQTWIIIEERNIYSVRVHEP